MRGVRPGSIQAAVQRAIKAAGGLECASDDIGVSVSNLSRATACEDDRPGGLGVNHLDRLGRIIPGAAEPLAEHFAHLAGGVYQPIAGGGNIDADIGHLTAEFADVLTVHAEAISERSERGRDYSPAERKRQIKELDELVRVAVRLRALLCDDAEDAPARLRVEN